MNPQALIEQAFVFVGLMATLTCVTKVILAIVHRRRAGGTDANAASLAEIAQRLARLEQAVDTTAIEIERISEGQRFTTKVLAERASQPLPMDASRARVNTPH